MTSMPSPSAWRRSGRLLIFSFPRSFTSRSGKQDPNSIPSSVPSPRILHRRPLASSFLFVDDHGCRLSDSPSFFLLSDLAADLVSPRRHHSSPCFFPYSLPTELSPPTTVAGSVLPLPHQCPRRLPLLHRPTSIPSPPTKLAVIIPHPRSSLPTTAGDSQNLSLFLPTSAATHVFLLSFSSAVADAVHRLFLLLLPPLPSSPLSFPSPPPLTAAAAVASAPQLPALPLHRSHRRHLSSSAFAAAATRAGDGHWSMGRRWRFFFLADRVEWWVLDLGKRLCAPPPVYKDAHALISRMSMRACVEHATS